MLLDSFSAFRQTSRRSVAWDSDVVIDRSEIRKRKKKPSKAFRDQFGHTPLSIEEDIPWECRRLVIGTGAHGGLPVMDAVKREAKRRKVELLEAEEELERRRAEHFEREANDARGHAERSELEAAEARSRAERSELEAAETRSRAERSELEVAEARSRAERSELEVAEARSRAERSELQAAEALTRANEADLQRDAEIARAEILAQQSLQNRLWVGQLSQELAVERVKSRRTS